MADDLDLAAGCSEVMVRRLLRGTGWTFIGMGSFVLYFLVYQLVGTNAVTSRGQSDLRNELQREWARTETYNGVMDILRAHSPYGIQVRFSKWALGEHASESGTKAA